MRKCSVCRHPHVLTINELLTVGNVTGADLAKRHGLSEMAVSRHRKNCIGPAVKKAIARKESANGDRLLERVNRWADIADESLEETHKNKDYRTIPGLLGAAAKTVELVAKLEQRPGFGDSVPVQTTVQIALVRLPELGPTAGERVDFIDVGEVRGQLSGGIVEGDCEDFGEV